MLDLPLVIEVLAVIFLYVAPQIVTFFFWRSVDLEYGEPTSCLRVCRMFQTVGLIFIILYIGVCQESGLASVGLTSTRGGLLLLGYFVATGLIILQGVLIRSLSKEEPVRFHDRDVKSFNACRTPGQRILYTTHLLLAAIEEEFFFRGYLILLWGQRTGNIVLCAILSGAFCLFGHWDHFRNKDVLFGTVCFTFVISWLTVVTGSIWLSLSAHFFMNLFVCLKLMSYRKRVSVK